MGEDVESESGVLRPDALKTAAQRNVQENAEALKRALRTWDEQRRLALLNMLSLRTFLVVVSTAGLPSAHRIFSVMNARGLDLSPADIFKADHRRAPRWGVRGVSDRWEAAEETLDRTDFADLFLHIRVICAKERAKRELLKEFPEQVLNRLLPDRRKEFVDDVLVPYAESYRKVQQQAYTAASGAGKVNQWLRRLNQPDRQQPGAAALRGTERAADRTGAGRTDPYSVDSDRACGDSGKGPTSVSARCAARARSVRVSSAPTRSATATGAVSNSAGVRTSRTMTGSGRCSHSRTVGPSTRSGAVVVRFLSFLWVGWTGGASAGGGAAGSAGASGPPVVLETGLANGAVGVVDCDALR